jgi:hypothetical protein
MTSVKLMSKTSKCCLIGLCFLAVVIAAVPLFAQVAITAFKSNGEIAWTNYVYRGFYTIERSDTPAGPWRAIGEAIDMDAAVTNRTTFQVPLTNGSGFYRVGWVPPDPVGVWDYRGYDQAGTLVITGQLNFASMALQSTNLASSSYDVRGSWDFQYVGVPTTNLWWLGPQIGKGDLGGNLDQGTGLLNLRWPTNGYDDNLGIFGTLWSNTYTGQWVYVTWVGWQYGDFHAARRTNSVLQQTLKSNKNSAHENPYNYRPN